MTKDEKKVDKRDYENLEAISFSDTVGDEEKQKLLRGYCLDVLHNSVVGGSNFDQRTGALRNSIEDDQVIKVLREQGYGMMALYDPSSEKIIAHIAYQMHEEGLHVFHLSIDPRPRAYKLVDTLVDHFAKHVRDLDVNSARISDGFFMNYLKRRLLPRQKELGIEVDLDTFWVKILDLEKKDGKD